MAIRPLDGDFSGETLYRLADPTRVKDGKVRPGAIQLPGTSCDRSKYRANPLDMWKLPVASRLPELEIMLQASADDLPGAVPGKHVSIDGVRMPECFYRFALLDDPLDDGHPDGPNAAHCQVIVVDNQSAVRLSTEVIPCARREALQRELASKFCPCPRAYDRPR